MTNNKSTKNSNSKPDGIPTYYVDKKGKTVNNINGKVWDDWEDRWVKECRSCGWRRKGGAYCPRCGSCA